LLSIRCPTFFLLFFFPHPVPPVLILHRDVCVTAPLILRAGRKLAFFIFSLFSLHSPPLSFPLRLSSRSSRLFFFPSFRLPVSMCPLYIRHLHFFNFARRWTPFSLFCSHIVLWSPIFLSSSLSSGIDAPFTNVLLSQLPHPVSPVRAPPSSLLLFFSFFLWVVSSPASFPSPRHFSSFLL